MTMMVPKYHPWNMVFWKAKCPQRTISKIHLQRPPKAGLDLGAFKSFTYIVGCYIVVFSPILKTFKFSNQTKFPQVANKIIFETTCWYPKPQFQHEAFAVCSCAIRLTSMTFEVTATLTKALRPLGKHTWSSMGNRIFTIRELFLLTGKSSMWENHLR